MDEIARDQGGGKRANKFQPGISFFRCAVVGRPRAQPPAAALPLCPCDLNFPLVPLLEPQPRGPTVLVAEFDVPRRLCRPLPNSSFGAAFVPRGLQPFSSMNSTPAASKACRIAKSFAVVNAVSLFFSSTLVLGERRTTARSTHRSPRSRARASWAKRSAMRHRMPVAR
jgi:hypothetical protein